MAPRSHLLRAGVVALAVALLLSGCSFGETTGPTIAWTTQTPTPSPTPTPRPSIEPPVLDVGAVVATGTLVGDPLISGDVDVRVTGKGTFELRLLDFHSGREGDIELRVSPIVVGPDERCTTSSMNRSYGNIPADEPAQSFPLPRGDPSFLDTVIIAVPDLEAFEAGCYVSVAASAILDWTIPDMRPGLVVADSGKTGGATGEVTLVDGQPRSYTVAADDLAEEVAARLGISVIDLFYLNPDRPAPVPYPLLDTGEVLNLSKEHR